MKVGSRVLADDVLGGEKSDAPSEEKTRKRRTHAGVRDAQGRALVLHHLRDGKDLLGLVGCLDKDHCETSLEMPLDVAMEDPGSGVVGDESDVVGAAGRHDNGVATHGVRGALRMRRVQSRVVGRNVLCDANNLVFMTMQVDLNIKRRQRSDAFQLERRHEHVHG